MLKTGDLTPRQIAKKRAALARVDSFSLINGRAQEIRNYMSKRETFVQGNITLIMDEFDKGFTGEVSVSNFQDKCPQCYMFEILLLPCADIDLSRTLNRDEMAHGRDTPCTQALVDLLAPKHKQDRFNIRFRLLDYN